MPKSNKWYYLTMKSTLTAFGMGFLTMSLEIMGFRVLAPHFGYSTYVFGALIGLILFAMAVGYWLGGICSNRGIKPKHFFAGILAAGVYLSIMSAFYEGLLESLGKYDLIAGTLASTFLLWGFPMVALAAVPPYLVGLRAEKEQAGRSAGWISMAGTVGGLAGTFLTSFYFLPAYGTRAIFTGNALAMVLISLAWLFFAGAGRKFLLGALFISLSAGALPAPAAPRNVVHAEESAYSRLEVVDLGSIVGLRADRRSNTVYSGITKDGSLSPFRGYELFAVPVAAVNAKEGLLLGLGAGTLPYIHDILNPGLRLVGVEIDPQVIRIGKEFFGLGDRKNVEGIVIADARPFLATDKNTYDVVELDIFREAEIPFYLATKEFFRSIEGHLDGDGVLAMNVYDPTPGRQIETRIANTAAAVFPETYVVPGGGGSFLIVGSKAPLAVQAAAQAADPRLASLAAYFTKHAQKIVFDARKDFFTDDHAPIETLYGVRR